MSFTICQDQQPTLKPVKIIKGCSNTLRCSSSVGHTRVPGWGSQGQTPSTGGSIHRWTSVKPEGRLHEKSKGHSISRGHSRDKTGQVWSHRHCVSQLQWMLKHQLPGSCNKTHSQQFQYSLKNPFCRKWTQLSVIAHCGLLRTNYGHYIQSSLSKEYPKGCILTLLPILSILPFFFLRNCTFY